MKFGRRKARLRRDSGADIGKRGAHLAVRCPLRAFKPVTLSILVRMTVSSHIAPRAAGYVPKLPAISRRLDPQAIIGAHDMDASAVGLQSAPDTLERGSVLRDTYKITDVLSRSALGVTYLAQDLRTENLCAVTEYSPQALAARMAEKDSAGRGL